MGYPTSHAQLMQILASGRGFREDETADPLQLGFQTAVLYSSQTASEAVACIIAQAILLALDIIDINESDGSAGAGPLRAVAVMLLPPTEGIIPIAHAFTGQMGWSTDSTGRRIPSPEAMDAAARAVIATNVFHYARVTANLIDGLPFVDFLKSAPAMGAKGPAGEASLLSAKGLLGIASKALPTGIGTALGIAVAL